jgi:uroporphyrin-III C-methyltransferase
MVRFALRGSTIVRLKGGDPSIFGRAAEERAYLEAHGIPVEVIPGITTASAAAAEFGFSLTTRSSARRVLLATGRSLEGAAKDWATAADPSTTLCLYMGCADIASITERLLAAGLPAHTPAIAAMDVSRPTSRLITSTVGKIASALQHEEPTGPVFICIGSACADAAGALDRNTLRQAEVLA